MTAFKCCAGGHRRKRVACPECGGRFTITYNPNVRRFKAKRYRCPDCGFFGQRGEFQSPWEVPEP